MKGNVNAANWGNLLLGAWLFLSPWFLVSSEAVVAGGAAIWNFWIVGLAVMLLSGLALSWLRPWEEWTNVALGVWLFFSAWMFAMPSVGFFWNAIVVGFLVTGLALMSLPRTEKTYQTANR